MYLPIGRGSAGAVSLSLSERRNEELQDGHGDVDWHSFTYAKLQLLRGLADNRSERQIADDAGMAYTTARWHVAQLKVLTGCHDVGELARWWRSHAEDWHLWIAELAGLEEPG